jgi:hydroxyacyl-ACP dehydratase HTD2-like protein with hotdog domain
VATRSSSLSQIRPGLVIAQRDFIVDEVDLFLFSAACWLPHRIHYDKDFARSEGFETVPVHGPLQAAWLVQLTAEWAEQFGARLVSSELRHVLPAYPHERLLASVTVESVREFVDSLAIDLELHLAKGDGSLATVGSAVVHGISR